MQRLEGPLKWQLAGVYPQWRLWVEWMQTDETVNVQMESKALAGAFGCVGPVVSVNARSAASDPWTY